MKTAVYVLGLLLAYLYVINGQAYIAYLWPSRPGEWDAGVTYKVVITYVEGGEHTFAATKIRPPFRFVPRMKP